VRDPNVVFCTAVKGVDVIYHLAALIAIPYSYHSLLVMWIHECKGTLNILQAALWL